MGKKRLVLVLGAVCVLALSIGLIAQERSNRSPRGSSVCREQEIDWIPPSIALALSPGSTWSTDLSFTSNCRLQDVVVKPGRAIQSYVSLDKNFFKAVLPGQTEQIHLSVSIPTGTKVGTYDGGIDIWSRTASSSTTHNYGDRDRERGALLSKLSVSLTVIQQSLTLSVPPGFQVDSKALALGGPVSLNNFGNQYQQGGIVPLGGAEIAIPSIPLPSTPLSTFIASELVGATITSATNISVSGISCTEEYYSDSYGPTLTYKNIAVYCPDGGTLYKFYLSYRATDPLEPQFLTAFQQILNTTHFTP